MADPKKNTAPRKAPAKSIFVILAAGTDPSVIQGVATNPNGAMEAMERAGSTSYKKFTLATVKRAPKGS